MRQFQDPAIQHDDHRLDPVRDRRLQLARLRGLQSVERPRLAASDHPLPDHGRRVGLPRQRDDHLADDADRHPTLRNDQHR